MEATQRVSDASRQLPWMNEMAQNGHGGDVSRPGDITKFLAMLRRCPSGSNGAKAFALLPRPMWAIAERRLRAGAPEAIL